MSRHASSCHHSVHDYVCDKFLEVLNAETSNVVVNSDSDNTDKVKDQVILKTQAVSRK